MTDWCILRCSASKTLDLARSLAEAGFDVWSPVHTVQKRARRTFKREDVTVALMPEYVFARLDQKAELLALSRSPSLNYQVWDTEKRRMVTKGHPYFGLFMRGNHRPIRDSDLAALRRAERLPKPKHEPKLFKAGQRVKTEDGGFAGLVGTVVSATSQWVTVSFPRWDIQPKLASWLLHAVDEPMQEMAA